MFRKLFSQLTSSLEPRSVESGSSKRSTAFRRCVSSLGVAAVMAVLLSTFCSVAHAIASPVSFAGFQRPLVLTGVTDAYGLTFDASGNLYVANSLVGTVLKLTPLAGGGFGPATTVASGLNGPVGVAVDSTGNLFVTVFLDHAVKEIQPNGSGGYNAPITLASSGLGEVDSIVIDGNGNLIVSDFSTPAVYFMERNSGGYAAPVPIPAPVGGWGQPYAVTVDSKNNVYVADAALNSAFRLTSPANGVFNAPTVLSSSLTHATDIAVDSMGNVYASTDALGSTDVYKLTPGGVQSVYASGLSTPFTSTFDAQGNLYIADPGAGIIWELSNNFGSVNVGSLNTGNSQVTANFSFSDAGILGGVSVLTQGASGLDFANAGTGTCTAQAYTAGQSCTVDVTFAPQLPGRRFGAVVLTDATGQVMAEANVEGNGVAPQAGFLPGTASYVYGNGSGAPLAKGGKKNSLSLKLPALKSGPRPALGNGATYPGDMPNGIVVDAKGNLYVTDTDFCDLYKSSDNGATWASIFSSPVPACPAAIAIDGAGNIFFSDANEGVYEAYLSNGAYTVFGVVDTPAVAGLAVDAEDNLYLTSNTMFSQGSGIDGVFVATNANGSYPTLVPIDGAPNFIAPAGIAVDASGHLFIADYAAGTISEEVPQSDGSYRLQVDIRGLDSPTSVNVDPQGNLYVVDLGADLGISILYIAYPHGQNNGYWLANSNQYSLFPVTSSEVLHDYIWWAAPAGNGNVYMTDHGYYASINELDIADPPSLQFSSAVLGNTSSDGVHDTVLMNTGNADLTLVIPTSGNNPSISPNFLLTSGDSWPYLGSNYSVADCTLLSPGSSSSSVAADTGCALPVSFVPQTMGTVNGTLVITNNSLNQTPSAIVTSKQNALKPVPQLSGSYATQTIHLTGNGLDVFSISAMAPTAILVAPGASATYTFVVTPVSPATTFPQAIVLSGLGGPLGTTYTFSQSSIPAGSGTTTIILTVTTPVTTVVQGVTPQRPGSKFPAPLALALILLPLAAKMRKAGKRLSRMAAVFLLLVAGGTSIVGLSGCYSKLIPATYTITVTGNSGAVNHSAAVILSVK